MDLRPYQLKCFKAVVDDYKNGYKNTAIILPTGSGKTRIFTELIKHHLDKLKNAVCLVISHLSVLTTQSKDRMNTIYPNIRTSVLQGKTFPESDAQVVYSTMQSAREFSKIKRWIMDGYDSKNVTFIVIDESHHTQTNSYDKIMGYFPDTPVLFVTATPYRDAQLMLPYFGKVSYSISTQELIDQEYLVPPILKQILLKGYEVEDRIAQIVELYQREEKGTQAIAFMKEIQDCKLCRNAFERAGVKAEAVNSDLTNKQRDTILDKFRDRKVQVLITCSVLSEGFDAPCAEVCFLPYKTSSPTLYLQRIGRFLRPYQYDYIHDNYDGDPPELTTYLKENARIYAFGDAPSIKKGLYKRMHSIAMDKGGKKDPDVFDELEYLDLIEEPKTSSNYTWTKEICEVSIRLEKLGTYKLYDLMRYRSFPNKFLKNLALLGTGLDIIHTPNTDTVTSKQIQLLKNKGFSDGQITCLDRGNASSLIAILSNVNSTNQGKYILTEGKFFGTHVKDVPYYYRRLAWLRRGNGYVYKGKVFEDIREYYRLKRKKEV